MSYAFFYLLYNGILDIDRYGKEMNLMNNITRQRIIDHINVNMDNKIRKMTIDSPFNASSVEDRNPFGFRLVPIEVWIGSKFERSFVTTLGQGIFEQVGRIVAEGAGAYAENQHVKDIRINTFQNESIDNIIVDQTSGGRVSGRIIAPNLHNEINHLQGLETRSYLDMSIISDLYVRRPNGQEEYYSFKTVKPNIDQTAKAKRTLLLLRTFDPTCEAFFALPYNPAGENNPYRLAGHSQPKRLFDMDDADFVLMGSTLWNKLGDDPTTFDELLDIFAEVGQVSSQRIRREYFGIDI